jgi:hypothetical protein
MGNDLLIGFGLVLIGVWLVRLIYAPVAPYTVFAMFLILLSMAYFSADTTYVPRAQLLYTNKA